MYCYTHCPQPSIRPPLTHASAGDSWTVPGKSGSDLLKLQSRFNLFLLFSRNSRGYLPPLSLISNSQNNMLSLLYNIFALYGSFTWMFWGSGHLDVEACLSKCELLGFQGDCGLHLCTILVSVH